MFSKFCVKCEQFNALSLSVLIICKSFSLAVQEGVRCARSLSISTQQHEKAWLGGAVIQGAPW